MRKVEAMFLELGHGAKRWYGTIDKGASYNNETERDLLKPVAVELLRILKEKLDSPVYDVGVYTNASLNRKINYINKVVEENNHNRHNCFCLCLHLNSSREPASGIEIRVPKQLYDYNVEGKLASILLKRMIKYYPQHDRGIKHKQLYIDYLMPNTVLIEAGFVNDLDFVKYIKEQPARVAESIANGFLIFLRTE